MSVSMEMTSAFFFPLSLVRDFLRNFAGYGLKKIQKYKKYNSPLPIL